MADKAFEPEDPMALAGMVVRMSAQQADQAEQEMAECFVEEYLRIGYSEEDLLRMFRDPFYRAMHAVYRNRGDAYVLELIRRVLFGESDAGIPEVKHG